MFGPKLTTVFANRWKALWWAATILATAYCSVPAAHETAGNADPKPSPALHPVEHPANPWAKE